MVTALDSRPTTAIPVPSATPAQISGSSIASSDPKTRNSTIPAAMNPKTSEFDPRC